MRGLGLSAQQVKIVELVVSAKKDKQIAAMLGIKRSTVRTHLGRIFAHLEVADRMELACGSLPLFTSVANESPERGVIQRDERNYVESISQRNTIAAPVWGLLGAGSS